MTGLSAPFRLLARALARAGRATRQGLARISNAIWAAWFTLAYVDEWTHFPAVRVVDPIRMRLRVHKSPGARLVLRGRILLQPFMLGRQPSSILLWRGARLVVEDDFIVSNNVRVAVSGGGELVIKGGVRPGAWGLHSDTIVMVAKRIVLGRHSGVSFNSWVTDSDWHSIGGSEGQKDVVIGDRVWVGSSVRVLKGANIQDDSIVAAGATVLAGTYAPRSLLAGAPARVLRSDLEPWA